MEKEFLLEVSRGGYYTPRSRTAGGEEGRSTANENVSLVASCQESGCCGRVVEWVAGWNIIRCVSHGDINRINIP